MVKIEKKAKLSEEEYKKFHQFFSDNGLKLTSFGSLILDYIWRKDWKPSSDPVEAPFALKMSTGSGSVTLSVKANSKAKTHSARDYELIFPVEDFATHLELLVSLGFRRYIVNSEQRTRFKYKQFNIALFHNKKRKAWMMEVEYKTEQDADPEKLEKDVDLLFEELHLRLLDGRDVAKIDEEISQLEEYRVDFGKVGVSDWLKKFSPEIVGDN